MLRFLEYGFICFFDGFLAGKERRREREWLIVASEFTLE
jgi:hypothetical protein